MAEDEFLEALTALEQTLADNQKRATLIKKRIAQLRRLRFLLLDHILRFEGFTSEAELLAAVKQAS